MSYIINNSRGQVITVVSDGTVNTSSTDLSLLGRGVTEYGEYQNENFVFLLENFANSTAPLQPILGQLWYNSATDTLHTYNSANTWTALASESFVTAAVGSALVNTALSGIPTAPTAAAGTNSNQIATTKFVVNLLQGNVAIGNVSSVNSISATSVATGALFLTGSTPLRLPNLTQTQIDALTPLPGSMVYNTTIGASQVYENGVWNNLIS